MPKPEKKDHATHPLLYAFVGVLIFAAAAYAGYTFVPYLRDMNIETPKPVQTTPIEPQPEVPVQPETPLVPEMPVTPRTEQIEEEILSVTWKEEPEEIESLNIFSGVYGAYREQEARYYSIGTVSAGSYQGADVVLIQSIPEGLGIYPDFHRFVHRGDELVMLAAHSDALYEHDTTFNYGVFSVDKDTSIPELVNIPAAIQGTNPRQIATRDEYIRVLFSTDRIKKSFVDKNLGDIYTTANVDSDVYGIYERHGFYARAADGTLLVYQYKPDFLYKLTPESMEIPDITFNDGQRNQTNYNFVQIGGCGAENYSAVVDPAEVTMNALVAVGKTSKGDTVYELKDKNHVRLLQMYEKEVYVLEGQTKPSYEAFLAARPILYYVDPFGRLIEGKTDKFIFPVECGKPVIYLYPETTQEISVQVEPQGGFSYTDPAYGDGWKVIATPEGKLTEVKSGQTYPYLFWEGRGGIYETPKKGFVVKQEDVEYFLVESLTKLGLNKQEIADFNEFWLPRMQNSPYYFVTFLGNRAMDQLAPLTIEPKPDTVIRVLMDFLPLEQPIEVEGYELRTPERKGFTVVEWGGVLR